MSSPVTTTSFAELEKKKEELIRKALEGSVFLAPMSSPVITDLTGDDGKLLKLPAGYEDLGWVDSGDAPTWSRKTEVDETEGWGSASSLRTDIIKVESSVKLSCLETKRLTLETYYSQDLSAIKPKANGEVAFDEATRPSTRYFRVLGLFVDGDGADAIYVGRHYAKANVTDAEDQKWVTKGGNASFGVTLQSKPSSKDGFAVRHLFGGPGWKALLSELGFAAS